MLIGTGLVIVGGLVSAAAAPTASYHSSWAVAYIVLVAGVAQAFLGLAQAVLARGSVASTVRQAELWCWNIGNAAVVAGTLLAVPVVLYLGCLPLIATLVLVLRTLAHAPSNWLLWSVRIVVAVLLVSIPTGIVLQSLSG